MLEFVILGPFTYLIVAAPTILLYSVALLPLWFFVRDKRRRWWALGASLLLVTGIAIAPGARTHLAASTYMQSVTGGDLERPAAVKPRTIEIAGDSLSGILETSNHPVYPPVLCTEVCRRLLLNREVDRVRMTLVGNGVPGRPSSIVYRFERRESCSIVFPENTPKAFRMRLAAGDCLIAETDDSTQDVTVSFTTLFYWGVKPAPPAEVPQDTKIASVKRLSIVERVHGGQPKALLQRTEVKMQVIAMPFYFGYDLHFPEARSSDGQTIGRPVQTFNAVDLEQTLRETFGFKLDPVEAPEKWRAS
jgi:hypothetical protein